MSKNFILFIAILQLIFIKTGINGAYYYCQEYKARYEERDLTCTVYQSEDRVSRSRGSLGSYRRRGGSGDGQGGGTRLDTTDGENSDTDND